MKIPIIGIVSSMEYVNKGIYNKAVFDVNVDYINLLCRFNCIPIIIPFNLEFNEIERFLKNIDGLLLIGGEDVSENCFYNKKSENARDNFEIDIYNYFKKNNKPILGICRGLQIINVAEGGTLKDIPKTNIEHFIGEDGWINYHNIKIKSNTKLKKILNRVEYPISSVHHQQIDKLGDELSISAIADDGVIEAIEKKKERFIIAFQGHIEKCFNNFNQYDSVIKEFIKEACNEK